MIRSGINPEFPGHLLAQGCFWEHASNRFGEDLRRFFLKKPFRRDGFEPPRETCMVVISFRFQFLSGEADLAGINHDHMVSGIDIGGKNGFVFPS